MLTFFQKRWDERAQREMNASATHTMPHFFCKHHHHHHVPPPSPSCMSKLMVYKWIRAVAMCLSLLIEKLFAPLIPNKQRQWLLLYVIYGLFVFYTEKAAGLTLWTETKNDSISLVPYINRFLSPRQTHLSTLWRRHFILGNVQQAMTTHHAQGSSIQHSVLQIRGRIPKSSWMARVRIDPLACICNATLACFFYDKLKSYAQCVMHDDLYSKGIMFIIVSPDCLLYIMACYYNG